MTLKRLLIGLAVLVVGYLVGVRNGALSGLEPAGAPTEARQERDPARSDSSNQHRDDARDTPSNSSSSGAIAQAYANHRSNVQVESEGVVERVLRDDNEGSRHQRFIVRVPTGESVLIAHNIDLARRVDSLHEGDALSFSGEYKWNDRGGVVHWTHRDPGGRHVAGWIRHHGQVYQ